MSQPPYIDIDNASTLEWIGFTPAKAAEIEKHWRTPVDKGPYGFLSYCNVHIDILECTQDFIGMSVEESMRKLGFKQWLIDVFLDPQFAQVRKTRNLRRWLEETVEIGWHTYDAMVNPQFYNLKVLDGLTASETQPLLPGHRSLYMARSFTEVLDGHRFEEPFSITRFDTYKHGDFNHHGSPIYFTPEKETAELFRRWVAARVPQAKTCLIRVQISETVMSSLNVKKLMYSDEWEEAINICKYKKRNGYGTLFKDVDVVHGHISCQEEQFVDGHKWLDEEGEACFGNLQPMKLKDGTFATQTAFMATDEWTPSTPLLDGVEGKIYVKVVPALVDGVEEQRCRL